MTRDARAAVTECVRLIRLLVDATTPHSKELAMIVLTRLAAIGRDGVGPILLSDEAETWCKFAQENELTDHPERVQ